jgi:hypothetical protein
MPVKAAEAISSAIKAAAGIAALAPGVVMMFGAVEMPPTAAQITKALSLAVGAIVVLGVLVGRARIERMSERRLLIVGALLLAAGCTLGFAYYEAGDTYVIDYQYEGEDRQIIAPIFPSKELRDLRKALGSYPAAVTNSIVGRRAQDLIDEQNWLTVPLLNLLLLGAQSLLLLAIVGGAWKFASTLEDAGGRWRDRGDGLTSAGT